MSISFQRKRLIIFIAVFSTAFSAESLAAAIRSSLLDAAFKAFLAEQGRWAYTETRSGTGFGGIEPESILRIDPSRPYSEQIVPIKVVGKTPTEKELKVWAQRGEREGKRQMDERSAGLVAENFHLQVFNVEVTPDLDHAVVLEESETSVTDDVPMRKAGMPSGEVFDKFQLTARVNKQQQQFERVLIRQRATMSAS